MIAMLLAITCFRVVRTSSTVQNKAYHCGSDNFYVSLLCYEDCTDTIDTVCVAHQQTTHYGMKVVHKVM